MTASPNSVIVNGTAGNDPISILSSGASVIVKGLAAQVMIDGEDGSDSLTVNGLAGNDTINASALHAGQVNLTLNGGDGDDTIIGSAGNDLVNGQRGNDVGLLGPGNDVFTWNPGDGSDTVEGQTGFDTLAFNGSNANENISISANGARATLFRDVGNVTMDLNSVERIQVKALGGADNLTINDLTGTGVKQVAIDLASPPGSGTGDGQSDSVIVNATNGNDAISVASSGTSVVVKGLSEQVTIDGAEAANNSLVINGLGGNDTINASALNVGQINLTIDGGAGNDVIKGGAGNQVLVGGAGNDQFVFSFGKSGNDLISDFQAHGASNQGDVVALTGFADHTFNQAVADGHIAQSGTDVAISDGTHIVATMQNILLATLHSNDFLFV